MRLSVSNIAWPATADDAAAEVLRAYGAGGVEIAPARVCERPWEASAATVAASRAAWEDRGLTIVALQALLFGRAELALFGSAADRAALAGHLAGIIDLAAGLGAEALVFGSPRNRRRGELPLAEAERIALPFFREIGRRAADRGVWLCLEANPPAYGCDFLTSSTAMIGFVAEIGTDGLGVHLDTGGMRLAGEDPDAVIAAAGPRWRHFHASEPHLVPLGEGGVDHAAVARALAATHYDGWVSVEMAPPPAGGDWRERLARALAVARSAYVTPVSGR
jgi:sugar phosphate isomerase/epimerase